MLGCNKIYTNTPLNGYHCTAGNYIIRGNVTQGFCTWTCLKSQQCAAMSYNPVTGTCLLASQSCVMALKHDEFMLMIFREKVDVSCAVWMQDEAGVIPDRILTPRDGNYVGRVSVNGDLLVGNANLPGQNWNTYIAYDGGHTYYPTEELLTIHPNCTMAWFPYKAGDVLPPGAIVTGMLANSRRLYSSLSFHAPANLWVIGKYAEGDTAAYYAFSGSNAVTQFDILASV